MWCPANVLDTFLLGLFCSIAIKSSQQFAVLKPISHWRLSWLFTIFIDYQTHIELCSVKFTVLTTVYSRLIGCGEYPFNLQLWNGTKTRTLWLNNAKQNLQSWHAIRSVFDCEQTRRISFSYSLILVTITT